MKKFSIIISSLLLILTLTTFNPNNFDTNFNLFKIKKIEIKNLNILDQEKIKNLFLGELYNTNLLIIDKKKIDKILNENDILDYIELKKVYPSRVQIIVHEREIIAILNRKKNKFYLARDGKEIKYFYNQKLKNLPNIFGEQKNFLELYSVLININFPISGIKSFFFFEIGRWDIILKNNRIIKLPVKNFVESLKNYLDLDKKINFEKYSIFDYRIKDQLILN